MFPCHFYVLNFIQTWKIFIFSSKRNLLSRTILQSMVWFLINKIDTRW